ncbi:hypothetical protein [Flavobacterium sp.]|uniref:hypothetical protein n=1 Tax=Flavobacterium sp. TaxID=239 RepID=UPI00286CF65D|nr:hypothetical protein [Flavobacterium sp.]
MTTKANQNQEDQEIDLAQILKSTSNFFQKINTSLYNLIQFFIKNWIITTILIVTGFGIGMYRDKTKKVYNQQITVTPNFGSTDYLYSKIDLIESKIKSGDTVFLKEIIGLKNPKRINKIEIEPIYDVYKFIENKPDNFELIKLMAEDGDIKKIIEDDLTSKNYTFHKISFTTDNLITDTEMVQPLLKFLNQTEYYTQIQKEVINNVKVKIVQNDSIIAQINGFLSGFSNTVNNSQRNDKLVYYNENTQLNDVIKTKEALIREQGFHRIDLVGLKKVIKDNNTLLNTEKINFISKGSKFLLPIIFIFMFLIIVSFKRFYNKQKTLANLK